MEDTEAAAFRPTPPSQPQTMEGKDDGVLYNGSVAFEKDESLNLTLDQYQEGDWDKEAEADADGTIDLLRDEIQGLQVEKREVERQLEDARKELHRAEGENRSLAAQAHRLEGDLVRTQEDFATAASAAEDFEAEVYRLKCAIKDLEADKASLIADKAPLEAKISVLEGRLFAAAEDKEEARALRAKAEELEMKVRDLTEELRLSKEHAKEAVEEQAKIGAAREEELEQVIKALKETNTRLEEDLAGFCSNINRNLGESDAALTAMENGLNVAWVAAAAASVGAVAVGAAAVYLHKAGQR